MNIEKRIAAVLVTFNRVELLKIAINSLRNQSYALTNIVVVNNNSNDGTKEYLDAQEDIISLHLAVNLGGAGGFHHGVKIAARLDVDYIWIMDDDAVADNSALQELINADKNIEDDWGFLCSKVLSDDGLFMSAPVISTKKNISGYPNWGKYGDLGIIGVDKATFVSFLTKKKHILSLGLPVKEMFIWGDDTEYSWRHSNKYNCYLVCRSHVLHKRMNAQSLNIVTAADDSRLSWYFYLYRNTFYNIKTHGEKIKIFLYLLRCVIDMTKVFLFSKNKKFTRCFLIAKGFLAGVFFRPKVDI